MKKAFHLILLSLIICCLFVSCFLFEANTVPIPDYLDLNPNRGLSTMSAQGVSSPFTDLGVAQGVMTTMPCISGLKSIKVNNGNVKKSVTDNVETVVYPGGIKAVLKCIKSNDDGFYLYYNIYDNQLWVGFYDYYYNTKTQKFSYRQGVFPTIEKTATLIFYEYRDVDIKNINSNYPHFAVGQMNNDGSFNNNAWLMMATFDFKRSDSDVDHVQFELLPMTSRSNGTIFASFERATEGYTFSKGCDSLIEADGPAYDFAQAFYDKAKLIPSSGTNPGEDIDTIFQSKTHPLRFDQTFPLVRTIFNNADDLLNYIKIDNLVGYDSYNEYLEFNLCSKSKFKDTKYTVGTSGNNLMRDDMSIYRYNNGNPIAASSQFAYKLYVPENDHTLLYWQENQPHQTSCYTQHDPILANVVNEKNQIDDMNSTQCDMIGAMFPSQTYKEVEGVWHYYFNSPYTLFSQFFNYPKGICKYITPEEIAEMGETEQAAAQVNNASLGQAICDYQDALCTYLLKQCGLEGQYAENFAKNMMYSERHGSFKIKVTAADPSTFAADYDAAN